MAYTLKNPTGAPTEAAFSFAVKLVSQANATDPNARLVALQTLPTLNAQQISDMIDLLKGTVKAAGPVATKQAVAGWYSVDGKVYQVKISKSSGMAYLMSASGTYLGAKGYSAEVLAKIVADGKAYAVAYAKVTGKCGVCNTKLTDPKSIEAGIGPVCAKKF